MNKMNGLNKLAQFIVDNYQGLNSRDRKVTQNALKFHRKQTLGKEQIPEEDDSSEINLDDLAQAEEYNFSDLAIVK